MKEKKLFVRMPINMDYFLPAVAFVHNYVLQLRTQVGIGMKPKVEPIVIELWREDQYFFSPLFPRMELTMGDENRKLSRSEWACVVDLRTVDRALAVAQPVGKHITDAWGIMFGASPSPLPELGYMVMYGSREKTWDILVEAELTDSFKLLKYIEMNYPEARAGVCKLDTLRCSKLMDTVSSTKLLIARRSAATYLATMLKVGLVEYYPDDLPRTFLSQPPREDYRVVFGDCTAESIWPSLETVWETSSGMKYQGVPIIEQLPFTAEIVLGK